MIIKKKNQNNIEIHSEIAKWCETNTHNVYLRYDFNNNKIYFIRCCHKQDEKLKEFSLDEFDSLSPSDIQNILNELNNIQYPNHDYSIYPCCKSSKSICDYSNDIIDSIVVGFLYKCNATCRMCTIPKKVTSDIDNKIKEIYFNFLNKLKYIPLSRITLTEQGEPFFYKKETFKFINDLNINTCKQLTIITNAINLNEDDIINLYNFKERTGIDLQIIASCSAISDETYRVIHNNVNFDTVVNNILLLKKYNLLLCVNFVVQRPNLHELEFLYDFWHSKDNSFNKVNIATCCITPPGKFIGEDKFILNSEEYKKYKMGHTW